VGHDRVDRSRAEETETARFGEDLEQQAALAPVVAAARRLVAVGQELSVGTMTTRR
jgi:hypothetical protein